MRKMNIVESRQVIVDTMCEYLKEYFEDSVLEYFASVFEVNGDLSEDYDFINLIDGFLDAISMHSPIKPIDHQADAYTTLEAMLLHLMDTHVIEYTDSINHMYWDHESIAKNNFTEVVDLFRDVVYANYNYEWLG